MKRRHRQLTVQQPDERVAKGERHGHEPAAGTATNTARAGCRHGVAICGNYLPINLTEMLDTRIPLSSRKIRVSEPVMDREVRRRLAVVRHVEEVTGKLAMTCR